MLWRQFFECKSARRRKNKPNFIAKKFFLSLHFNFEKKTFCLFMIQFYPQFCQNNIPSYHPQSRECVVHLNYYQRERRTTTLKVKLNLFKHLHANIQNLKSTSNLSSKYYYQNFFLFSISILKIKICLFMIQFSPQFCQNHTPSYHPQSRECVVHLNY